MRLHLQWKPAIHCFYFSPVGGSSQLAFHDIFYIPWKICVKSFWGIKLQHKRQRDSFAIQSCMSSPNLQRLKNTNLHRYLKLFCIEGNMHAKIELEWVTPATCLAFSSSTPLICIPVLIFKNISFIFFNVYTRLSMLFEIKLVKTGSLNFIRWFITTSIRPDPNLTCQFISISLNWTK